jgi:hypothetical protein
MLEWNWNAAAVRAAVRPADPSRMNADGCSRGKQNARHEQYGSGVGNRPLNNTGSRAPDLLTERCGRGRVCCDLKRAREAELRSGYVVVLVGRSVFVERNDILPLVQVTRNLDDGPQAAISMAYSAEHRLVCRCWHWTLRVRPYLVPTRASAASQVRSCSIVKGERRAVGNWPFGRASQVHAI